MFSYCFTVYFDRLSVLGCSAVEIDKTVGDLALDTRDLQSIQDNASQRHFDMCICCDGCFIAVLLFGALVGADSAIGPHLHFIGESLLGSRRRAVRKAGASSESDADHAATDCLGNGDHGFPLASRQLLADAPHSL